MVTAIVAWLSVDARKPSAPYLASDSRISWTLPSAPFSTWSWDYGRKIFSPLEPPEIVGYCGDVLFPSMVLGQIVEKIDRGLFFIERHSRPLDRFEALADAIIALHGDYPNREKREFSIIYCARDGSGMECKFFAARLTWSSEGWARKIVEMPTESGIIINLGSGSTKVREKYRDWISQDGVSTSRAAFGSFCDPLSEGSIPSVGGAPQLAGLFRKGPAILHGAVYGGAQFYQGHPVDGRVREKITEWRNELFEVCDCCGTRRAESQRHARATMRQDN